MRNSIDILPGSHRIINLSGSGEIESLRAAELCETIKIKIHNLTPQNGPITIPVRMEQTENLPIAFLEEVVRIGIATKNEFRALQKLCRLLNS